MMCEQWQLQAQGALERVDRLTELLSEGAHWARSVPSSPPVMASANAAAETPGPETGSNSTVAEAKPHNGDEPTATAATNETHGSRQGKGGHACKECQRRADEAAAHMARVAELEVQVQGLQMEALRSTQMSAQVGRAVLPALYAIESRLVEQI